MNWFFILFFFPAGVGVPLMLTYVYGVVPMSLCRNGWCRPQSEPPETHKIQLEDLASFSDHWTGQNNPTPSDTSVQEVRVSVQEVGVLPSTSTTPPELDSYVGLDETTKRHEYTQQDSPSDCEVVIVPDSKLDDTQAAPLRDGTNIEVRVEIETHPRGARQSSLSSILSSRSLSVESLGHSQSQSQDYMCASELEGRRDGGGGKGEEQEGREKPGGEAVGGDEGTPVFEIDGV
ncbi:E3 ubiquitin-protein ligase RNF19B-like isoform X2 [Seriola lalandi dorsalis]|uniref:E3 ubiquitin-protein ligase RNF19B-like isoform X2 n=1 Tax=Seriola lalandi dorsalis TaxID=1841481 RepID=UPI000C6FAFB4|nr:E3 ubiquitin-protein ligase RNF19B-like isoform X2 [Seriola lalandi dorsalis]